MLKVTCFRIGIYVLHKKKHLDILTSSFTDLFSNYKLLSIKKNQKTPHRVNLSASQLQDKAENK